jgi:hypothetical protein
LLGQIGKLFLMLKSITLQSLAIFGQWDGLYFEFQNLEQIQNSRKVQMGWAHLSVSQNRFDPSHRLLCAARVCHSAGHHR